MANAKRKSVDDFRFGMAATWPVCVGWVDSVSPTGELLVDYSGNSNGPIRARVLLPFDVSIGDAAKEGIKPPVMLAFEQQGNGRPIVLGGIADHAPERPHESSMDMDGLSPGPRPGRRTLSASEEVLIECGKSSIRLTSNGRVMIKGDKVTSRASRTNKVKGASVEIN